LPLSTLVKIAGDLYRDLKMIPFHAPVANVYDPADYAREPLKMYLEKYGQAPKRVVFVGMNPGPWGMVQTGVPFGEVNLVRDWMGIEGNVGVPERPHPKRPVEGFTCRRREVSGQRLWGWARRRFGSSERFFRENFVLNYCPLAFFDERGRNLTPEKLRVSDRETLFGLCDDASRESIRVLEPQFVLGIGKFAFERLSFALEGMKVRIGRITHPSPANPMANRGWEDIIEKELAKLGITLPPLSDPDRQLVISDR